MTDYLKLIYIHIITLIVSIVLSKDFRKFDLNCFEWRQFLIFILNIIIIIVLSKKKEVKTINLVIYFIVMTVLIFIVSLDSSIWFGPHAKNGIYFGDPIINELNWIILFLLYIHYQGHSRQLLHLIL